MNKEFLKKLIRQRTKQINVLKKLNSNSNLITEYENDIMLAKINFLTFKLNRKPII